jgi:nitrogen regulatory protein PII
VLQSKFTTTSLKEGLTDNINSSTQYNILSEFLKYKQQADVLSQFMNVTSYDTKGIETSLIGAVSQKEQYEKVIQRLKEAGNKTSMLFNTVGTTGMDGFFNYYNEDKQYQQTFLGKMQEIVFKSENILTPIYTDAFKYAVDIMKQYNIKTNSSNLVNKYTSIINGVINTTLANMKLGDSSIQRRSDALFTGANSLANRILEIRDKRKDMKFLEALSIDAEDDIHTISLQNSNSLDTFESSDLTDSFYELEGVYPDIANDLIDAVILQSGVSNNPLTYYGIIPFEKIMERVGQYYQNDYFHSTYKDIVILNDYKKLLEFGSGVTMENRAYTKPRKAYYEKADKKGDILRIYLNGNVYLDYGGVIKTKEGETLLEITNAKKDYKSGASMFGKAYEPTIDNTSTYAKYVGMSRKEVQPSELDKFVLDNADAINKGLITKEQVDYYANNC